MATNKRTYPNSNFVWYNDDNRLAILAEDNSSTGSERTTEKYDTFQGTGNLSGTITGVSRVDAVATYTTSSAHGLATGDRVSISGTTNFNDAALSSQSITVPTDSTNTFTMTLSADTAIAESGITATFISLFIDKALRITFHAKYEEALLTTNNLQSYCGLDSALHSAVVCYIKARLYEDDEDMELAMYYRKMYEQKVKKFRGRRSAVRHLAVSRL
tara:strand:- start:319 stop:966 length:648 start_codon:yes stop_codon:yes gene_type:complete